MPSISMNIFSLPNLLSASRLILGPLAAWSIIENLWLPAAVALMTAIATDLLDGWLARRWQQTSALGGLIDHGSDAFMVALMLLQKPLLVSHYGQANSVVITVLLILFWRDFQSCNMP